MTTTTTTENMTKATHVSIKEWFSNKKACELYVDYMEPWGVIVEEREKAIKVMVDTDRGFRYAWIPRKCIDGYYIENPEWDGHIVTGKEPNAEPYIQVA